MRPLQSVRALLHALLGRSIKPFARRCLYHLLTRVGMVVQRGACSHDPSRPTAVVASHEASTTGAPILALNIAQHLSATHNVVVLLLKGGALGEQFQACSTALIQARFGLANRKLLRQALRKASPQARPVFAVVNSVVSAPLLEPLRGEGIPCVSLIHEFVTYIKPLDLFSEVGLWSSRVVCSTPLTWNDIVRSCPQLTNVEVKILPQGRCQLPAAETTGAVAASTPATADAATTFLKRLNRKSLLVLGAGLIQTRKGVDLFIAVAEQIRQQVPELDVKFAWIGKGYNPDRDLCVSAWVKDQISRSGLEDHLVMLDESPAYRPLIDRCDLFVVSSRLDPLPNVAIDAMQASTPVLCFDKACGIANLLEEQPTLHAAGVAPYLDCTAMANKAVALLRSAEQRQQLGALTKHHAERWFDMTSYLNNLIDIAEDCRKEVHEEEAAVQVICDQHLVDPEFSFPSKRLPEHFGYQRYLLSWRRGIRPRKPFPGFHPGIYRSQQLPSDSRHDPLVHWHQQGRPSGPWLIPVIQPTQPINSLPNSGTVALHIHVFYPELLDPILERLGQNATQPDLFISFSNSEIEADISRVLREHKQDASLHRVPNRGRDIGPLLSELGCHLDRSYTMHGHLHTKKSVLIDGGVAAHWREFLLTNLLGTEEAPMADAILSAMHNNPELGLVFPDDPGCIGWTANRSHADALATRLQLGPLPEAINFPVGTMFWARQGALSGLYDLGLSWEDYPDEPLGYDGTMLHAIERLLPQICLDSGMSYAVTHVPGFSR